MARRPAGRALGALPDDLAAMANVATAHHLVHHRHGYLLFLRRTPQQAGPATRSGKIVATPKRSAD